MCGRDRLIENCKRIFFITVKLLSIAVVNTTAVLRGSIAVFICLNVKKKWVSVKTASENVAEMFIFASYMVGKWSVKVAVKLLRREL